MAREARRSAEMASMPSRKTHFLNLEQRWLHAAESVAPKSVRETKAPMAQPKIATPAVDQPLRGPQEGDIAAPPPDEMGDEQAGSANLVLTIQCRGFESAVPLRLSNHDIARLALEAEVHEISLGQLLATLIEAAMAEGLSRVLAGAAGVEREGRLRMGQLVLIAATGQYRGASPRARNRGCCRWLAGPDPATAAENRLSTACADASVA